MAGHWRQAIWGADDIKVGDQVMWEGQRLQKYRGRVVAVAEYDYAISRDEDGRVFWKGASEFHIWAEEH